MTPLTSEDYRIAYWKRRRRPYLKLLKTNLTPDERLRCQTAIDWCNQHLAELEDRK